MRLPRHGLIAGIVILVLLLSSLLPACGGGPNGSGALNLTDNGPLTLDPAIAAESGSGSYIIQIFSGLVRLDEDLKIAPDIAQSWEKSNEGKTFTFRLRRDVAFHNGKAVKAGDFKYSWERALAPATGSTTAQTYLGDIAGAEDMLTGKAGALSGVKVIDDHTLQVTIDQPKAYFLYKMAFPTAFVLERANVESGKSWWQRPVGTGPFKLRSYEKDQSLVLERNGGYYGEKAKLSQVSYKFLAGNPVQLYQQGKVDVTGVPSIYIGLVTDASNPLSRELSVSPQFNFFYIGFNAEGPPFDDVKVRQAFTYAVDKERVTALSALGTVEAAYGILPPGMPGRNPGLSGLRFDPVKARALLSSSMYGSSFSRGSPEIVFTTSGYGGFISSEVGGVIEEWRRNLGVEVTVRQIEPEPFAFLLKQEKDQLYDNGWIADYPDPQNFLDVLFHTGTYNNTGGYSNHQVDRLLDQAGVEQDQDARLKLYQQAEQLIVDDAAVLPLFFARSYVLVKPWVKGYSVSPLGFAMLNKVSIEGRK
ncbi:MAG: peptide ABC transporter substrate-binding protein [Chloroflexi bacterium]|nr:peptide ABC transporter substrate-binding protein [Chloroflexota bacterium]